MLQIGLERQWRQFLVGSTFRERKLLSRRQTDDPCKTQLLLRQVVGGSDQLLLARLQFNLGAELVDGRTQPCLPLIVSLVVKRLCILHLRLRGFYASRRSNRQQVGVSHRQNHKLACILVAEPRRLQALGGRPLFFEIFVVEQRLAEVRPDVQIVERPNHSRQRKWKQIALKSQRGKARGLNILSDAGRQIRQKIAEFFPPLAVRLHGLVVGQQQA